MSQTLRRRSRARQRGYTLVELMMALALFTVAMLGIISMQKITVISNTHAKNVAIAERIAQAWGAQLEMDATAWRSATSYGAGFLSNPAGWQRPLPARGFGSAFDALGNPLSDSSTDLAKAQFCTHVRLSWLYPPGQGVSGNTTLRAEIRVFWLRDGEAPLDTTTSVCAVQTAAQAQNIGLSTDRYYFVYQTVGVRQHFQI